MADVYMTREGYEKLRNELEFLKTTRRREITKAIAEARAHGDLSENAEYDAAKDAQGHNEKRIAELEETLSRARLLENENIPTDQVLIGATVKLKDMDTDEEMTYTFVTEEESDFANNKISISSPIGTGLLGHKENEVVEVKVPAGVLRFKIIKISR
ncbi:MAG: transcription elongation factor GreA [Deltaproteobacteria bacterium]